MKKVFKKILNNYVANYKISVAFDYCFAIDFIVLFSFLFPILYFLIFFKNAENSSSLQDSLSLQVEVITYFARKLLSLPCPCFTCVGWVNCYVSEHVVVYLTLFHSFELIFGDACTFYLHPKSALCYPITKLYLFHYGNIS